MGTLKYIEEKNKIFLRTAVEIEIDEKEYLELETIFEEVCMDLKSSKNILTFYNNKANERYVVNSEKKERKKICFEELVVRFLMRKERCYDQGITDNEVSYRSWNLSNEDFTTFKNYIQDYLRAYLQ